MHRLAVCNFEYFLFLLIFFVILYKEPTNAQLIDRLSHSSYMFRHYCVILEEFVVSTLLSYTSMSKLNLIERTNKIQPCSRIYYSSVS